MSEGGQDLGIDGLGPGTRIGEGGSAVVYRARQDDLDREVAVKVLRFSADEATRRRFDRERRVMGSVSQHDGIVTVYETGFTATAEPYIIMPLFERSLADEIAANGPAGWERSAALMAAVSTTVGFAHEQGIVHRDIKPANIMLTASGRPMVADFGIARVIDSSTQLKSTALTLTPVYSPPEALETTVAMPASDVYSIGATLYHLVAGHPPFVEPGEEVSLVALMRRIMDAPVPRMDGVPPDLQDVLDRAMAKRPEDRHPSASSLATALEQVGSAGGGAVTSDGVSRSASAVTRTVQLPPPDVGAQPTFVDPPGPSRRRSWVIAAGVAVVVALALIGAIVLLNDDEAGEDDGATPVSTAAPVTDPNGDRPGTTAPTTDPPPLPPPSIVGLTLLGSVDIAADTTIDGERFTGITALTTAPGGERFHAVRAVQRDPDDGTKIGDAVLFDLEVDLGDGQLDDGDIDVIAVHDITGPGGRPYGPELDAEGFADVAGGSSVIVSEGRPQDPGEMFVDQLGSDRTFLQRLDVPEWYLPQDGPTGVDLDGFNGATAVDGDAVIVAMESPLKQDHDPADPSGEKIARLIEFDVVTGAPVAEWGYPLDRIPPENVPENPAANGGIAEITATAGRSLIVLERSRATGAAVQRFYQVDLPDGSPVGPELPVVVEKRLVLDTAAAGVDGARLQSMTLGPELPDGRSTLLLAYDVGFRDEPTSMLALAIDVDE